MVVTTYVVPTIRDSGISVGISFRCAAVPFVSIIWNAVLLVEVTSTGFQPASLLVSLDAVVNNVAPCSPEMLFVVSEDGMLAGEDVTGCVGDTAPDDGNVDAGGCGTKVPAPGVCPK